MITNDELTPLKHHFVLFPTAFHYPELNTSQLLRSSWVRTGISSWHGEKLLQQLKFETVCTNGLHVFFLLSVYIVLLGVLDQKVGERTFQANMERRVAMLLGEAMGLVRRVKRATTIGNSSVQVLYLCMDLFNTVLSDCIHSCIAFGEDSTYRAKSIYRL